LQKYKSIDEINFENFSHIIAGAFFQMQRSCINRIREINTFVNGELLYIDVVPGHQHHQLLLTSGEREKIMLQFGARHYLSITESQWPDAFKKIRKILRCESSLYLGPFFLSGLTETNADTGMTRSFLTSAFGDNNVHNWRNELGYYFPVTGKVVLGNKIGRTIGYPTINIEPEEPHKLIPSMGVYSGMCRIRDKWYRSMINIGIRPTLDLSKVTIEAHVFDFAEDVYGEIVSIHFIDRIRDEMRFGSLDQLKTQLNIDQKKAFIQLKEHNLNPSDYEYFIIAD
jgi:hypothetical protein